MSHSSYHLFAVDGTHIETKEMRNGHGSSPVIWDHMTKKYLDTAKSWLFEVARFWTEPRVDATMSDDDRFLMHMTYDRALLPREEFRRAAELVLKVPCHPNLANHWPEVCAWLLKHADDLDVLGFGMSATSVSEDPWIDDGDDDHWGGFNDARTADRVTYGALRLQAPS